MRRAVWCSLLLCAAVAWLGCATLRRGTPVLRVLVYNIHAGKDAAGRGNLDRVAALVRSTGAGLVLLQEVDRGTRRSGHVDQVQALMQGTRYGGVFGRTLDYDGGTYGIAMLSRGGFTFDSIEPLPVTPVQTRAGGSHEPRGALVAGASTPIGRLQVLNTHLDPSRDGSYRLQETARIIEIVGARLSSGTPLIAGGDFNSEPSSEVHERLRAAGLRDAWEACGHGEGLTYPADKPVKRIDYLWLTGTLQCSDALVIDTQASDHRPLLVTISQHQ